MINFTNMSFTYDINYDFERLTTDNTYALNEGLNVRGIKSANITNIEQKLKDVKSDDPDWVNKVTALKRELAMVRSAKEKKLYIIKYNKKMLNHGNINTLGMFRSVITDGENIVSFAPPKSYRTEQFKNTTTENSSLTFTEFLEGTMINMFVNPNTGSWDIATRSNIGARCQFYKENSKTFREMFLEAFNNLKYEFSMFNEKYSYSWVLQHPANRIVTPVRYPRLYLTHIFSFERVSTGNEFRHVVRDVTENDENQELFVKYNVSRPEKVQETIMGHVNDAIDFWESKYRSKHIRYVNMGTVITDITTGFRSKIRNPNYEYVRTLKGNSPKLQYQYYNLRQMGAVKEYLKYYPENREQFTDFRNQLHDWTFNLKSNYIRCYVNKEKPLKEFPFQFRSHMYQLHQYYLTELREKDRCVDLNIVITYVNSLPCGHLMHSINYPLRKTVIDEKKEELTEAQTNTSSNTS
jgi:hypothetical protein